MTKKSKAAQQYVPEWKGAVEGYAVNQVTRNLWRVIKTHDRDDLMQEARIAYWKCEKAYPVLDTPEHFMALYKTALRNRINELSNKNTRTAAVSLNDDWQDVRMDDRVRREQPGDLDNDGYIATLVKQAPREVAMVLSLFLNAPAELLDVAEQAWNGSTRGAEKRDVNAMIRRLLGPGVGERPVERVESYFGRD